MFFCVLSGLVFLFLVFDLDFGLVFFVLAFLNDCFVLSRSNSGV